MTKDSDFKQVVRARMSETGESYTAARAAVEASRSLHEDFAYLRRELVNYRFLEREGGRYRTAAQAPERSAIERQEIPAWEAHWLPGFLAGSRRGRVGP